MVCNGRKLVSEPEWTRFRPKAKVSNRFHYNRCFIKMEVSWNVHVDGIY